MAICRILAKVMGIFRHHDAVRGVDGREISAIFENADL